MTIPIVTYHDIDDAAVFGRQIRYMHRRWNIISTQCLEQALIGGGSLPERPLLITFDDAYPSVYTSAFPILRDAGIPATVFVITELVDTDKPFWWDEIPYYLPEEVDLDDKLAQVWKVKEWPNRDRLNYLDQIRRDSAKPPLRRQQLSWDQLAEMRRGGITIGNHTHDHPMLDRVSGEERRASIDRAKRELDSRGFTGRFFAYPNGNTSDSVAAVLEEVGITMAFLFDHKLFHRENSRYRISRLSMNSRNSVFKTRLIMKGYHSNYMNFRRSIGL